MKSILFAKLKESLISVLPIALIVVVLSFTPLVDLTLVETVVFCVCAIFLILGMSLFNLGADIAMTPMGEKVGFGLVKRGSLTLLLIICFCLGLFITIAEPDLTVLAEQVSQIVNNTVLIVIVGVGVGLFLLLTVLKIVFKKDLSLLLMFFYLVLFAISAFIIENGNGSFLPLAFDSGGVTTGPITVPFIMALGVGLASAVGGKGSRENSFGLIAMCSIGPIIAVACIGLFGKVGTIDTPTYANVEESLGHLLFVVLDTAQNVGIALGIIVVFFLFINLVFLKIPKYELLRVLLGIVYTYIGLVIFLSSVHIGFMPIGYKIGQQLASFSPIVLCIAGLVIGMVVVLAEPAVHVLNKQVEEITGGTVKKSSMMIALSVGVGVSLCLSMIRIVFRFSILYYLIPGYFISLGLSFFVPKLYTAIAFDSGGVASGPLTSTFILPLAVGACVALGGNVMADAFGMVAMVAMTPLITIQLLGFRAIVTQKVRDKIAMRRILDSDDMQIINFM
jgi:hypothetical protein